MSFTDKVQCQFYCFTVKCHWLSVILSTKWKSHWQSVAFHWKTIKLAQKLISIIFSRDWVLLIKFSFDFTVLQWNAPDCQWKFQWSENPTDNQIDTEVNQYNFFCRLSFTDKVQCRLDSISVKCTVCQWKFHRRESLTDSILESTRIGSKIKSWYFSSYQCIFSNKSIKLI